MPESIPKKYRIYHKSKKAGNMDSRKIMIQIMNI